MIKRIAVGFIRILENSRVRREPPHALSASRQFADVTNVTFPPFPRQLSDGKRGCRK
jgi:hypothetical protein